MLLTTNAYYVYKIMFLKYKKIKLFNLVKLNNKELSSNKISCVTSKELCNNAIIN